MTPEDFKRLEKLGADAIRLKNRLERIRIASAAGSSVKDTGFGCASTGRLCLLLHAGWITSIGCFDICG